MLISYKRGQTGVIVRVKILNSSVATGAGLTGLTNASSGLVISTIADNEASATVYAVGSSNVETITTLGTYAAPTSGKCRFKEVDATNHKGVYEIHLADARFAVSNAKSLLVSISGATNAAETDVVIPLVDLDPYSGTVVAGTVNDKTGYSLAQAFPANFSALQITVSGLVAVGMNADKTGYSVSSVGDKTGYKLASDGLDQVVVEAGLNARQALAITAASAAGKLAGAATTTITIAAAGVPATNRITATVDSDGNRTAVTLSPPA